MLLNLLLTLAAAAPLQVTEKTLATLPKDIRPAQVIVSPDQSRFAWISKDEDSIFLVVDGLPAHKAKSVRRYLETVKDRIRLFFLPPYAPQINPDELVWNDVKNNGVGRALIRNPADLAHAVNSRLRLLQRNPDNVRAFFHTDNTRYAAAA